MDIRSIRIGRIAIYGGMVERGYNGMNPTWLGFAYGSWLPHARVSRQGPSWCLDARWLCFYTSIYWNDRRPMNTPVYADQEWRDFIDEFVGEAALNQLRATFEAAKISESMEPPRQHSPRCRMSRSWRRKCSCEVSS